MAVTRGDAKGLGGQPRRGWVVVGVSATVNCLAWSVRSTFALFYVSIRGEFGWARGETALGYSLSWLFLLVFAPLAGWLGDRWGARTLVPVGGLVLGMALACTSQVTALWQYYVAFGLLGAAGIGGVMIPAATIVTRWFGRSRGMAMGIFSAGASASAVVFYPINAWLVLVFGWRRALLVFGLLVALVTIPLASLLYRDPPKRDVGRHGAWREFDPEVCTTFARDEWTLGRALGSLRLWAASAMWGLGVIGYQILTTHQVAYAVDRAFRPATLGWVFAVGGLCTVVGNVFGGWLSDRRGRGWVFAVGSTIGIAGIACLSAVRSAEDLPLLLLYTASGFGFGMRIAQLSAIPADLFEGRHLGQILGIVQGVGGLGGAVGPWLGGWLFDVTGSYQLAFATATIAIAGSALAAWIAAPRVSSSRTTPVHPS